MYIGCLVIVCWIFGIALLVTGGLMATSPIMFLLGVLLLAIPLTIGDFYNSFTLRGRIESANRKLEEKQLEKEYGTIDFWKRK